MTQVPSDHLRCDEGSIFLLNSHPAGDKSRSYFKLITLLAVKRVRAVELMRLKVRCDRTPVSVFPSTILVSQVPRKLGGVGFYCAVLGI